MIIAAPVGFVYYTGAGYHAVPSLNNRCNLFEPRRFGGLYQLKQNHSVSYTHLTLPTN